MTRLTFLAILPLLALTACGPIDLASAEDLCFERARQAQQPRGEVFVGAGTNGLVMGGEITITSDYLGGRDPSQVYDTCVYQKSGQPPSRPLHSRPDWKA